MFFSLVWHGVLKSVPYDSSRFGIGAAGLGWAAGGSPRRAAAYAAGQSPRSGLQTASGQISAGGRLLSLAVRDAFPGSAVDRGHAGGDPEPSRGATPEELGPTYLREASSAGRALCSRPDAGLESSPSAARDVRALAGPALRSIDPGMDLLVVGLDQWGVARIRDRDRARLDSLWGHTAQ